MQDDAVAMQEPLDALLACVRQVMLLAKPSNEDPMEPDSVVDPTDLDTVPSVLKASNNDSQQANQVRPAQCSSTRSQLALVVICAHECMAPCH